MLFNTDEAGAGTALIVGCMSGKQGAMWTMFVLTRFAGVCSECMFENRQA